MADTGRRAMAAILLLQSGQYTMDTWSTLNSSPWTGENVGADPEKLESLKRYCYHAAAVSTAYCAAAAYIDGSWWPIIGAVVNNAYLAWVYKTAVDRAQVAAEAGKPNDWGMGEAKVNELPTSQTGSYTFAQA
jgi:hypothetical protein